MNELSRQSLVLWEVLRPERQRSLILTLEGMVLHRIRHAPVIEEISDDERDLRVDTVWPAA